jgi:two-component system response regulator HydG
MTLEEMEEEAIRTVLGEVGGNRRKAAERLGIGERTLYRKIKKFGLDESS